MSHRRIAHGVVVTAIFCTAVATEQRAEAQITETATLTLSTAGSWVDGTSWLGGVAPTGGATTAVIIPFNGQTTTLTVSNTPDPFILNLMAITTTTRNFYLNGGTLDFQGTAAKLMLDTTGTVTATINSNITFGSELMVSVTGTNVAAMYLRKGITSNAAGAATLTLGGSAVNVRNIILGQISDGTGTVSLYKADAGLWTLSNANNTFSGGLTIEQGWLRFIDENSLGAAGGTITLGTAANLTASLSYSSAAAQTFTREIGIFGSTNRTIAAESSGAWTFAGPLNFLDAEAKSIVLSSASTVVPNDFQSLLTDNGAQQTRLTKTGLGLWVVSNTNNDFTGGVFLESGNLRATDTAALNLLINNLTFLGTTNTLTTAVLESNGTFTNSLGAGPGQVQWSANAGGGFSAFGGDLHVTLNNDAATPIEFGGAADALRLSSTNELQLSSPTADSVTYIHNAFTLAAGLRRINVENNPNLHSDYAELTGTISGAGGIYKTNDGRLVLSGSNDFTGGVTIHSGMLEAADVNKSLNLQNLTLRFSGANGGTGGVLQTSGSLNFAGLGTGPGQVTWLNNGSGGFAAAGGDLNVTLTTDTATPLMWGVDPFIRGNGELILSSTDATGVVTFSHAIDLTGGNRRFRVYENADLKTDWAVISGNLSDGAGLAGAITKTGDGLLVLEGTATFSGGIVINAGTLRGADPGVNLNILDQVNGNNVTFTGVAALRPTLETAGSLTNSIGTGNGQIRWAPISSTGASGGFSAFGGGLDITLNNDAATPLVWNSTTGFLRTSGELQFNTIYSDDVVTWNNAIDLNNLPRIVRVTDNPDSENDFAVMTGVLSSAGTTTGGLIVTGGGKLVLTADNSYTLTTTVTGNSVLHLGDGGTTGGVGGNINVAAGNSVVFNHSSVYGMSTRIAGAGTVFISGGASGGVLFTDTTQAFTGPLVVDTGSAVYGRNNALSTSGRVELNTTGTLDLNGFLGTIAKLDDGLAGGGVVANNGLVPTTLTISSTTLDSSFSGTILDGSGGLSLVKASAGTTLTLGGANTYSGGTTVTAGTLVGASDGALGTGLLRVNTGAVFSSGTGDRSYGAFLSLSGSPTFTGDGNVAFMGTQNILAGSTTVGLNNTGNTVINGMLLSGSLTAVGSSALTLTGVSEVTGAFSLTNNTDDLLTINDLILNNTFTFQPSANPLNIVGTLSSSGGNRIFATMDTNTDVTLNKIAITAAGDDTSRVLTLTAPLGATLHINGEISDGALPGGGINLGGRGTYVLSGSSSFSGLSSITGTSQQVVIQSDNALGIGMVNVNMTSGAIVNNHGPHTLANGFALINTLTISGTQQLTVSGVITNSGTNRTLINNNSGGLILAGGINLAEDTFGVAAGRILTIAGDSPVTIGGVIAAGGSATSGTLNITNTGGVTLLAESTFNGRVTINTGRQVTVGDGGTQGSLPNLVMNRGTLIMNRSDAVTYSGVITGNGDLVLNGPSSSLLRFDAAQTYTGATSVVQGTLQYGLANATPTVSVLGINSTGTVDVAGFNARISNLVDGPNGGGQLVNSDAASSLLTLIAGDFSGVIAGTNIGVSKIGTAGVLKLSGANAFAGLSTLNQGTIIIGNDQALGDADWNITGSLGILQSDGQARVIGNNITLSGNATISGSSDLTFNGTVVNFFGNRTLTIDNSGVTTFNALQLTETTAARILTVWQSDESDVVFGEMTSGANNGGLYLNSIAGSVGGATVLFNHAVENTRTILVNGVGRSVAIADGVAFKNTGGGNIVFTGSDHTFTLGAGASIGAMGLGVTAENSQFHIFGDFGSSGATTATISLTGNGSKLTVHSGGSIGNGLVVLDNGTTLEIQAGATAGTGAITTVGAATIILDGTKGVGNGTLQSGAVLLGSGSSNGTWTAGVGSSIFVGGVDQVGTLTLGRLILAGGTLNYDLGANSDSLVMTLTNTPAVTVDSTIFVKDSGGFGVGDYTLISGYNGTIGNLGRLNVVLPVGFKNTIVSNAGALILQVTAAATKTWDGNQSNVWNDGVTANFSGATYVDADQDAVYFGDVAATTDVVIDNGGLGVAPSSVLFDNSSAVTYTLSGDPLTGGAQFVKRNDGLVVILNNNTSTGAVQISGGAVQLGDGGTTGQFDPNALVSFSNSGQLIVNRSDVVTLSGNLVGTGGLVMNGSGTLLISGTNGYNGGTTVNAGALEVVDNGVLSEFGGVTVNGGIFNLATTVGQVADLLTVNGGTANINLSGGSVTLTETVVNGGTLNLVAGNVTSTTFHVAGGTVNLDGPNLLAPSLFNLEDGVVNLNASDLTLSVSQLGGGNGTSAVLNVGTGLTLSIRNTLTFTAAGDGTFDSLGAIIQGAGVISISANKVFVVHDSINAENDLTISSTLNLGGLIKTGAGRLYFTGENLSPTGIFLNGGEFVLGSDTALGGGTVTVTTGTLASDATRVISNAINVRGGFTITGTSALTFAQMTNIGNVTTSFASTAKTTVTNFITADGNQARTLTLRGPGEVDLFLLSAGSGTGNDNVNFDSLEGTGIFNLLGANTYSGISSIRSGEVRVFHNDAFQFSSAVQLGVATAVTRSASLLLGDGVSLANNLIVNATATAANVINAGGLTGSSTFAGNVALGQDLHLLAPTGGTTFFTGVFSGAGGVVIAGPGTVEMSGANTYSGVTAVQQGTFRVGSATAFGNSTVVSVDSGATVDLNGVSITAPTLTDGAGGGGSIINTGAAAVVTVNDGVFSGVIGGGANVGLVKDSAGTLVLAGNNTYSGDTAVNAGTLDVSGNLASANTTIASGAFLVGSGTIAGAVDVDAGGTLGGTLSLGGTVTSAGSIAPAGSEVGTLTVAELVLNGGSLDLDLGSTLNSDQIVVTGGNAPTVSVAVPLNFTTSLEFDEGTYTLISGYTGTTLDGASFANLSTPTTLSGLQVALQNNSGALQLEVTTTHLTWDAGATNLWNTTDLSFNDDNLTVDTAFSAMSVVTFDNTAASQNVVVDAAGVAPHHVIVNNDATAYTFAGGAILGTSLTMNGAGGTLFLHNDNTYARGLTINAGVVEVGDGTTNGSLAADVVNNALLSFNRSDAYTFAGNISGTGGLQQVGTGTLILTGDNTYTGITSVFSGALEVQGNFASQIVNVTATTVLIEASNTADITFTGGFAGNVEFQQTGDGETTLLGNNTYTGATIVDNGSLVVGDSVDGTLTVDVNPDGTLTVAGGGSLTTPGSITVDGSAPFGDAGNVAGVLVVDGDVTADSIVVGEGGVLQGSGTVAGPIVVESGGALSPGNSVGSMDGSALTLNGGSTLVFEFRDATGTIDFNGGDAGGTGAGFGWDLIDMSAGLLDIGDASASDPINIVIDAWHLDNSGHDDGIASTANFDPLASYEWLFIATTDGSLPSFDVPPDDDFARRFVIVDDLDGGGVFSTNNAFTRPESSVGQGTFRVAYGNLGQGTGLYITYSAIPEPGSMILAGLASLGAGWYGRRRMRRGAQGDAPPA